MLTVRNDAGANPGILIEIAAPVGRRWSEPVGTRFGDIDDRYADAPEHVPQRTRQGGDRNLAERRQVVRRGAPQQDHRLRADCSEIADLDDLGPRDGARMSRAHQCLDRLIQIGLQKERIGPGAGIAKRCRRFPLGTATDIGGKVRRKVGPEGFAIAVADHLQFCVVRHAYANRVDSELSSKMFRHLLNLPLGYFEARRVGDSVARIRELENIRQFLTSNAVTVVIDLFFTIVFFAVMFLYSPFLTLIVLLSIPCYVAISMAISPTLRVLLEEKFRRGAENQSFLVETVTGIGTLKAMAVEPQMRDRWEKLFSGYTNTGFDVAKLANTGSHLIQVVSKLTTVAILYFGAKAVIAGDLSVGALVAFNMLSGRVAAPILRLSQLWQDFQQVRISVDRLADVLNTPAEPEYNPGRASLPPIRGDVSFDKVRFRYRPDMPETLRGVTLELKAGEMLGIVGPSGSGKSTLTKLVQRLYIPEQGRVLVDGVDLALVDPPWLRRQIGVVLQENILFNRTVRENIALGDPTRPMESVMTAAQLAGAHEFILQLNHGYDTVIEERGSNLSGGQRQRLAIARALVNDPRILIFDEATSALDAESEEIIQHNLASIAKGRTVIIIAHRLSAVRQCDRIITVEAGEVTEQGSHEQLLRAGGRYSQLYTKQMGVAAP